MADELIHVRRVALEAFVSNALVSVGTSRRDADYVSECLVRADRRGKASHGVHRLPSYLSAARDGLVSPAATPKVLFETAGTVALDGGGGWGHVIARHAMEKCIEKARTSGVGFSTVRNSNHIGEVGLHAELATHEGMIGLAFGSGPWSSGYVAPWGALKPLLDTNPIAMAFPGGGDDTVVVDMATSTVARGKIQLAADRGEDIPIGWAFNAEGSPTTDPKEALEGSLTPLAGHKGYALGLAVDLLCGALSGAPYPYPNESSQFFGVLDPRAFGVGDSYPSIVRRAAEAIRSLTPRAGFGEVRLPGERAHRLERRTRQVVSIRPETFASIRAIGASVGLAVPEEVSPHSDRDVSV